MYVLSKSYGDAWRIAIPASHDVEMHRILAARSIWGNTDKNYNQAGIEFTSYEFNNWSDMLQALNATQQK